MTRRLPGVALKITGLLVIFLIALVVFSGARGMGWLAPLGITTESNDSQVITAVERTEDVSLVSLGIQGLMDKSQNTDIAGWPIPGTTKRVWVQYTFQAKLGIDGSQVEVTESRDHNYEVSVPEFTFIGFDEPDFKVALEDNDFTLLTEDIDQAEMVSEVLSGSDQEQYISTNRDLLEDQTAVFYDRLITSIDPDAKTTYVFSS